MPGGPRGRNFQVTPCSKGRSGPAVTRPPGRALLWDSPAPRILASAYLRVRSEEGLARYRRTPARRGAGDFLDEGCREAVLRHAGRALRAGREPVVDGTTARRLGRRVEARIGADSRRGLARRERGIPARCLGREGGRKLPHD